MGLFGASTPQPKPLPPPPPAEPLAIDPSELARRRRLRRERQTGVLDLRIDPSVPVTGMGSGLAITQNQP